MAITEITLEGGERVFSVETEAEFARVLDRGVPIVAPEEIAAAFGFPEHGDGQESGDDFAAESDDQKLARRSVSWSRRNAAILITPRSSVAMIFQ